MALDPLITEAQVEARLGRALTATESARIDALIADVSAAIRNFTGQQILENTSTQLLKVLNGAIRFPQLPVTAINSVTDTLANALTYTWIDGDERLTLDSSWYLNAWEINTTVTGRHRQVIVGYDHGYAVTPDDIVGVACAVAIRTLSLDPGSPGLVQESIAGYSYSMSVTLAAAGNARAFGLLKEERDILEGYKNKVPVGPIALML